MKLAILDMGDEQYGDCLYIENGGVKVLIDGGHPGDFDGQPGTKSVPAQLAEVASVSATAPFEVDLLVVTHSHADHIGCLPKMVKKKKLRATYALVSDPDHRWRSSALPPDAAPALKKAIDLLAEEVPPVDSFASKDELRAYLDERASLESTYREMIADLKAAQTKVVRYSTDSIPSGLRTVLNNAGLKILGPTAKHLKICADGLATHRTDAHDALAQDSALLTDAGGDYVELYSQLARGDTLTDAGFSIDASKTFKGAVNDLSIVFSLKLGSANILLAGDMQLALPEVDGLEKIMAALVTKVENAGPYDAIKLAHHTSENGWNKELHTTRLSSPILIHSGGKKDEDHPDANTLKMLKQNAAGHKYFRTDRNGLIQVQLNGSKLKVVPSKGAANDFSPNIKPDTSSLGKTTGGRISMSSTTSNGGDYVRVQAEIPNRRTRVVLTVDIDPVAAGVSVRSGSDEKKN